jgi:hypothetical protein
MPRGRRWLVIGAVCALSACAALPPPRDGEAVRCEQAFAAADAAADRTGVADGHGARAPGFPYLRTDRFLASLAAESLSDAQRNQLVDLMARAAARARAIELDHLPADARSALDASYPPRIAQTLQSCIGVLRKADASKADFPAHLAAAAQVPDDYDTWKRVVGLYPLAMLPFAVGVRGYERETLAVFATPLDRLPRRGAARHYTSGMRAERLTSQAVATIVEQSRRNPLGIPMPAPHDALALIATFSPDVRVDEAGEYDRIGSPAFAADETVTVGPPAVAYVRFAFARIGERVLPQIVYTFWFNARPKTSSVDLLSGALDGVVWRVTIGDDGRPLAFDSIHPCGCYHQFFPTDRLRLREIGPTIEETALVPQQLPRLEAGDRITLVVESGTHYLQRVLIGAADEGAPRRYAFAPDDALRRLPHPRGGTRSLFGPDGIVPGSERAERYVFWPMGVREPGAMRQWTRHATAFIGRRHFDEPRLIERYFVLK